jgi:hypothetical protein
LEKRSICLFLTLKGHSSPAGQNKLTTVIDPDAIANSIMTKQQRPSIRVDLPDEPPTAAIDQAVLHAFEKRPFFSICELA